jgi:uncharacterized membrane protein
MNSKNITSIQSYNYFVTVLLLTIVGFVIRYHGLSEWALSEDDIWHYHVANQKSLLEVFFVNFEIDGHPPLAYFIWYYINNIFGFNEMALRAPAMIAGLALIPASYFLGKEIFKTKNAGLFFATFFTFSDLMCVQSQVVRGYTLSMLFIVLAMLSCFKFKKTNNTIHLFLYLIFAFWALMSEFAIAPLLVYTALGTLWVIYKSENSKFIKFLIWVLVHVVLLASIYFILHLTSLLGGLDLLKGALYEATGYTLYYFRFISESGFFTLKSAGLKSGGYILLLEFMVFNVLFILGIWSLYKKQNRVLLFCTLFYLFFIFIAAETKTIPADVPRRNIGFYIIIVCLFYAGIKFFIEKFKPNFIKYFYLKTLSNPIILIVICLLSNAVVYKNPWRNYMTIEFYLKKNDVSKTISYLENNVKAKDIVISDWITSLYYRYYKNKDQSQQLKQESFSHNLSKLNDNLNFYLFDHPNIDVRSSVGFNLKKFVNRFDDFSRESFDEIYMFSLGATYFQFNIISKGFFRKEGALELDKLTDADISYKERLKKILKGHKQFFINSSYCKLDRYRCEYTSVVYSLSKYEFNSIQNLK